MTARTSHGVRPWLLAALVCVMSLGAAALAFFLVPAHYSARATALLTAPKPQVNSDGVTVNPYGDLAASTARLASLTASLGNGDAVRNAARSHGGTADFTVSADTETPVLTIRASGSSADDVVLTARLVSVAVGQQIAALQTASGIPVAEDFQLRSVASPTAATRDENTRVTAAAAVLLAGLLLGTTGLVLVRRRGTRTATAAVTVPGQRLRLRSRSVPTVRRPATLASSGTRMPLSGDSPAVGGHGWEAPLEDAETTSGMEPLRALAGRARATPPTPDVEPDDVADLDHPADADEAPDVEPVQPAAVVVDEIRPEVPATIDLAGEVLEPLAAAHEPLRITAVGYEGRADPLPASTFDDSSATPDNPTDEVSPDPLEHQSLVETAPPAWSTSHEDALAQEAARAYAERFPQAESSGTRRTPPSSRLPKPAERHESPTSLATADPADDCLVTELEAGLLAAHSALETPLPEPESAPAEAAVVTPAVPSASIADAPAKRKPATRKPAAPRKTGAATGDSAVGTLRSPRTTARHQKAPTPRVRKTAPPAEPGEAPATRSRTRKSADALVDNVLVTEGSTSRRVNGSAQQPPSDPHDQ